MPDDRTSISIPVNPWATWQEARYDPQPLHGITFCTYEMLGGAKQLLYVGATKDPIKRLQTHVREKPWWREVWSVQVTPHTSFGAALAHEDQVIETGAPAYNRTGPRHRFTKATQRRGLADVLAAVSRKLEMP